MHLGQRLYNSVFPPRFELSPQEQQLLTNMYPNIDWRQVVFNQQLPWFLHYTFAIGVALPNAYRRSWVHIHLRQINQLRTEERWCILVHEAFHVQQYYDLNSLDHSGWGYNRRFMRYYLGWYFQTLWVALWQKRLPWRQAQTYAYRQHPMERTAYWQEGLFRKHLRVLEGQSVTDFFAAVPHLVCTHSRVPETPTVPFHGVAILLTLLIALSKPLLDIFLYPLALVLGGRSTKLPSSNE